MLCSKCKSEGVDRIMEIRGTQWFCPVHKLYGDFPARTPTLREAFKIIADKDKTITELEDEISELRAEIKELKRHLKYLDGIYE